MSFNSIFSKTDMESEPEFISLMSQDEENQLFENDIPKQLPILPLRNMVLFPGVVIPITAGRTKSIQLIQESYTSCKIIGVTTQKEFNTENPNKKDLYAVGTIAKIVKLLKMPDGSTMVILQGKSRFKIKNFIQINPYFKAEYLILKEDVPSKSDKEYIALIDSIRDLSIKVIQDNPNLPSEAIFAVRNIENSTFLVNFVAANMNASIKNKQNLLEKNNLKKRAMDTLRFLNIEHQQIRLKNDIQSRVRSDMDQQQREYFLHQQIKAIQEELGDISYEKEVDELKSKGNKKNWPEEVKKHFQKELLKMQRANPQMPDYTLIRNYLDFMLELPWMKYSKDNFDLKRAQRILNRDHYGLDKVKERIIEYLAVLKIKGDMRSPILCMYGPPGVGKTSLGKSIAIVLNRKYSRISLGGVHDEAEIRGHRKTYIGAMPGRLLQCIKKSGTSNPVILLDEIDKMGKGIHGDPSSAMLEVLDPEQNNSFYDNFLELGYDFSRVMFITTANNLSNIQPALLDRIEVIEINGYNIEEKIHIARKHLFPKQLNNHGLKRNDIIIDNKCIEKIIECYTRESGVRNLDKKISKVIRYAAKNIAMNTSYYKRISLNKLEEILGPPMPIDRYEDIKTPGVVTGLAWTSTGGDILYIESIIYRENKNNILSITGNLGNVMKESATIALKYIKANYKKIDINYETLKSYNIHIHVPEGAVPKDGPSAGLAMLISLVSSFKKIKVKSYVAMTGEITLRGRVLPVGGIKEKILAAKRAGIKEIIISYINKKDLIEINKEHIKNIIFHYIKNIEEAIKICF